MTGLEEISERLVAVGNVANPSTLIVILGINDAIDGDTTYTEG
jgi:hypothetical protein